MGTNSSISSRINRLPLSRELSFIMLLAGFAWLIESYDIGIIGNILPLLGKQYTLSTFDTGLLAIASTLGIVVALIPAGRLADSIGRKKVLIIGTVWYALFSLLCGFAPNVAAIEVLRFLAGLGMGMVFPIPYALATEFMPANRRGAMVGILDSFLSFGYFLAPLIAFALTPILSAGLSWRTLFFIGGLPLLYIPVLIKWMPESPRWLQTQGRDDEADAIVSHLETRIEQRRGQRLPAPTVGTGILRTEKPSLTTVFRWGYIRRTLMMCVSFSCILFIFYAIQTYTPTVLVKMGYGVEYSFLLTTIIVVASIPGKYLAAYCVERFGRKPTLIAFTLIAAVSSLLFGFLAGGAIALLCGIVMSFFGIGVDPVIKVYGAEQYPTYMRETGVSVFESSGRLFGGALAPFIMAFLLANGGITGSYVFVAIVAVVGVLSVALFGIETKGRTVEQVSELQSLKLSA
jgi:MFS transporter, putative metabolite:H+ symporter